MWFSIHGVGVHVESLLPAANHLIEGRLAPYRTPTRGGADFTLTLRSAETSVAAESIPHSMHWVRSRPLWGHFADQKLSLTDGASVAEIDYRLGRADFAVHADTLADSHFFARTFFLLPLTELLRTKGFFYLHSALLTLNAKCALLLGEGGSGKSTLCAALLKTGWTVLGDDNILLRLNNREICEAFPLEQELSVSAEIAEQLHLPTTPSLERGKHRYSLELPKASSSAIPTDLFFLSSEPDQRDHLPSAEAFERILNENPMLMAVPHLAPQHMKTIETLLRQTVVARLHLPRIEPLELVELARHFPVSSPP
jgi:hypothetical protein